jgi:aminopeptidase N
MKLFTYTAGYPLITATYRDKTLSIAQKRFLVKSMDHNDKTLYHVPITYASNGSKYDSTVPVFYLTELEANIQLKEAPKDYIILNVQQAFFYRVNYDEENWRKIGMALRNENHDGIHVLNRAQIIDDLFNLARAGVVKYQLVLEVVEYLKNETHYIPWLSALMALDWVASRMSGGDDLELFSYYIKDLSEDVYRHLMYNSIFQRDRRTDIYTRVNILTWLCKFGHEDCLKHTKIQFTDYLRNKALAPNADYRVLIYCNGVRQGGEVEFKFLKDRYNETLLQVERSNILQRLACTKDQKLMDVRALYHIIHRFLK